MLPVNLLLQKQIKYFGSFDYDVNEVSEWPGLLTMPTLTFLQRLEEIPPGEESYCVLAMELAYGDYFTFLKHRLHKNVEFDALAKLWYLLHFPLTPASD